MENDDEEEDEQSSQSSKQPSSGETGTVISSQPAKYSPDDQEVLDDLIDFLDGKFCVHGVRRTYLEMLGLLVLMV